MDESETSFKKKKACNIQTSTDAGDKKAAVQLCKPFGGINRRTLPLKLMNCNSLKRAF